MISGRNYWHIERSIKNWKTLSGLVYPRTCFQFAILSHLTVTGRSDRTLKRTNIRWSIVRIALVGANADSWTVTILISQNIVVILNQRKIKRKKNLRNQRRRTFPKKFQGAGCWTMTINVDLHQRGPFSYRSLTRPLVSSSSLSRSISLSLSANFCSASSRLTRSYC
jgi:hypothetical protein